MPWSSMKPDAGTEGQRWLAQAENDLAFAALASREGFFAQACFNSQQAAEKALKAFLYARGAEQAIGHSVADLAAECARLEPEFAKLKERAAPRPRPSPLRTLSAPSKWPVR